MAEWRTVRGVALMGALTLAVLVVTLAGCARTPGQQAEPAVTPEAPPEAQPPDAEPASTATATFGVGCFWCGEGTFRRVEGVVDTEVGFMGGTVANPSYEQVSAGDTGHTEVVHLTYDPAQVSYDHLLDVFWSMIDPTQVNGQGPDIGYNYRSVIFYSTPEQQAAAEASKRALEESGTYSEPIATAIEPAATFYSAEEYHQDYYQKKGVTCPLHLAP